MLIDTVLMGLVPERHDRSSHSGKRALPRVVKKSADAKRRATLCLAAGKLQLHILHEELCQPSESSGESASLI